MNERHVELLRRTSRTFLLPILQAPPVLRDTVGPAYLCMRAIDEIEDHEELSPENKAALLRGTARILRSPGPCVDGAALEALYEPFADLLDDVTLELADFAEAAVEPMRPPIRIATADMADEMADWVASGWTIRTEADLDGYTFTVAGRVGLLLSRLWSWYDGSECDDEESIAFGRALQTVNIVRNRDEDLARGVDFFPNGWSRDRVIEYAWQNIAAADRYMEKLDEGAVRDFCILPLGLAKATLEAISGGKEKLSRSEVNHLVARLRRV
ncbi:MAG: squalene/phytoene synthase family protein [Planctomycetota bacterium]